MTKFIHRGSFLTGARAVALAAGLSLLAGLAPAVETVAPAGVVSSEAVMMQKLLAGRDAVNAGKLDAAQSIFMDAAAQFPRDPYPWIGIADVARLRNKPTDARDAMARAVSLAPNQPRVLQAQAKLMIQQADYLSAERTLRRVVELAPDQIEPRATLATVMDSLGRKADARAVLDGVASARGVPADKLGAIAQAFTAIGEPKRALQVFDQMIAAKVDNAEVHMGRGDALQQLSDPAQALASFQRAADLVQPSPALEFRRGLALENLNREGEAEAAYRSAIALDANAAAPRNNLAQMFARRGVKLDEALQLAQRAAELDASAPVLDTLGAVHLVRGEFELARKNFERAVAKAPGNPEFRQRLDAMVGRGGMPRPTTTATAPALPAVPAAPPGLAVAGGTPPAAAAAALPPVAPPPRAAAAPATPALAAPVAAAATVAAKTPSADAGAEVGKRLNAWLAAWEGKQVDNYLRFYASAFTPAKLNRAAWEADRRVKLNKPGAIEVKVQNPKFEARADGVVVSFTQAYASADYRDSTRKRMEWVQEGGEWRIKSEATVP